MRTENMLLLEQRWPEVAAALQQSVPPECEVLTLGLGRALQVSGIQLESAYDPTSEAQLQASLAPRGAEDVVLYGLAQGHLVRALLARGELRSLRVVVLSRVACRASMEHDDHSAWLADERVELQLAQATQELEFPLAVASSCLSLADEHGARLRDLLSLELAQPHVEKGMDRYADLREQNLLDNRELVRGDPSVQELFGLHATEQISIAAAGPTLSDHFEELRASSAPLIALDASLKPLLEAGILPDYVVTQDCVDFTVGVFFELDQSQLENCKLIYFPSSVTKVLQAWRGERFCACGAQGFSESMLWSSGSVIHPALDLALKMGAGKVRFYGADFATPNGRSHVSGSCFDVPVPLDPLRPRVLNGHGEQVQSLPNLVGYLRDLERYLACHPEVRFENAGRRGAQILGAKFVGGQHAI